MKKYYHLCLIFLLPSAIAFSANEADLNRDHRDIEALQEIKFSLINGNTDHAKLIINRSIIEGRHSKRITDRYLAMIHFIEENFAESLAKISDIDFQDAQYFSQVCHLLVLDEILENKKESGIDWHRCRKSVEEDTLNKSFWMDAIVYLKNQKKINQIKIPFKNVRSLNGANPDLKLLLKMSLYLNRHKNFVENIFNFDDSVLDNPELRELLSFMLFREYELVDALRVAEDLDTSNIHNMKGNLHLLKEQKEQAFAEFKLSYKKKRNSINALERLIPLAWDLEQDEFIIKAIKAYQKFYPNDATPKIYQAAVLVKQEKYQEAELLLRSTLAYSPNVPKDLVLNLTAYIDWKKGNVPEASKHLRSSCQNLDRVSCWVFAMDTLWEGMFVRKKDLSLATIKHDNSIIDQLTKPDFKDPLEEVVFINQKQIDEMDDKLIKYTP